MKTIIILSLLFWSWVGNEAVLTCWDKNDQIRAVISLQGDQKEAYTKGFRDKTANHRYAGGEISGGIYEEKGAVVGLYWDKSGNYINIEADHLKTAFCSGCAHGVSYKYLRAVVHTNGAKRPAHATNLTCELEKDEEQK